VFVDEGVRGRECSWTRVFVEEGVEQRALHLIRQRTSMHVSSSSYDINACMYPPPHITCTTSDKTEDEYVM